MLIALQLQDGDWSDIVMVSLVYRAGGKGTWRVTTPYWINLLAYETEGEFVRKPYSGYPSILCYDSHNDDPAFVIVKGPSGEWDKTDSGVALIVKPRNPYGLNLDVTWRNDNLVESTL
jgi:hypothetical protein